MTPREAFEEIRKIAQGNGPEGGDTEQDLKLIESICDDMLVVEIGAPLPSKACSVCGESFQFNEQLLDHVCPGCGEDLCPGCECCS